MVVISPFEIQQWELDLSAGTIQNMQLDWIIVALGNPGSRYALTRHNVGFMAADLWAQEMGLKWDENSSLARHMQAHLLEFSWEGKRVLWVKPQTFMNLSGSSLTALFGQKGQHLRQVPVVCLHDEIDLEFQKIRVKNGGGDAGHNGLKSVRQALGHGDFYRIRMGVGRPAEGSVHQWVLAPYQKDQLMALMSELHQTLSVLGALVRSGLTLAQAEASKNPAH